MNSYARVIVLCEDRQHEVFMRTFLVSRGVPTGRIRVRIAPEGRGSGEQCSNTISERGQDLSQQVQSSEYCLGSYDRCRYEKGC